MYSDDEKVVLCGASAYEQKYYFNQDFASLPQSVQDELHIMCVMFTVEIGGIFTMWFDSDGSLQFETEAVDADAMYDEIGGALRIKQYQEEKKDLLESLELYVLSKQLLLSMVDYCAAHDVTDFSRGVLQPRLDSLKLMPYVHQGYVGRFQSVDDYYHRSMDLLDPAVRADLFNPARPIRTKDQSNPSTYYGPDAVAVQSLVADGCYIEGVVENSILSRGVIVEKGAKVSNSVLMQGTVVKAGASLAYVIADKNVVINEDRMLMGHATYPLAIAKNSVV